MSHGIVAPEGSRVINALPGSPVLTVCPFCDDVIHLLDRVFTLRIDLIRVADDKVVLVCVPCVRNGVLDPATYRVHYYRRWELFHYPGELTLNSREGWTKPSQYGEIPADLGFPARIPADAYDQNLGQARYHVQSPLAVRGLGRSPGQSLAV